MVGRLLTTKSVNGVVNGGHQNGNHLPPPSTLAAQLVRDHADTTDTTKPSDSSATFGQLLQEILSNSVAPETDSKVNYKLVRVVTEAGLDVLSHDNPFAQWDVLVPQAVDSVAVIRSTIQRQPELLFASGSDDNNNPQHTPHLLLWLLPKLLRTASNTRCQPVQRPICTLLSVLAGCLAKTLDHSPSVQPIIRMYCDSVNDTLSHLENLHTGSKVAFLDLALPPVRSLAALGSNIESLVALPAGSQLKIVDVRQAFAVAATLLTVLQFMQVKVDDIETAHYSNPSLLQWTLEAISRLNSALIQNRGVFGADRDFVAAAEQVLDRLASLVDIMNNSATSQANMRCRSSVLISQGITDWLYASFEKVLPLEAQQNIVSILNKLTHLQSDGTEQSSKEILLRALRPLVYRPEVYASCIEGLQDIARRLLRTLDPGAIIPTWAVKGGVENGDVEMTDAGTSEAALDATSGRQANHTLRRKRKLREIRPASKKVGHAQGDRRRICNEIKSLLGGQDDLDFMELCRTVKESYTKLTDAAKEQLWTLMSLMPCVTADSRVTICCSCCNGNPRLNKHLDNQLDSCEANSEHGGYVAVLQRLLKLETLQDSSKHRVLATLAVRSLVIHTESLEYLDLSKSFLGEWCLRGLTSSVRELRVAAGRTLVAFLRVNLSEDLRDSNRRLALDYLRKLSDRDGLGQHETLILAWGQIAIVCGEKELNLALLRLVEYLGHSNTLICSLASTELEKIVRCLDQPPEQVFKPFWRSVAVAVVRDLPTIPQKAQQLAEFLEMSVDKFLILTQKETLPALVLTKKLDVLQRVAQARSPKTTVQDIILQPRTNLASVLALLLAQPSPDIEETASAIIAEAVPQLKDHELVSLIKLDAVLVACEMLKAAGDEETSRKSRAYQAIQMLAVLVERKSGQAKASTKHSKMLVTFFETHVLGIMTHFSEAIEALDDAQPISEKIRCLCAIEEMIQLARTHINVAVPQIRACLQSAIDQKGLLDPAFSAWLALMRNLDGEDVVHLLDHLFAVTVQHWSSLTSDIQQRTYDTIAYMLKTHSNLIRDEVITIPSLAEIPLMSKFESEITRLRDNESHENHLYAFARRLKDENASIVLQALHELIVWLNKNQTYLHEGAISEPPLPVVPAITRAVLDACIKYSTVHAGIVDLCAQCIGIIGCLDPNRIEANFSKRQVLVLSNFDKATEVIDWVAVLLEDVLVRAFKSATNARTQGFLAYVMQELLKFSNFNEVATIRLRASQSTPTYQRWIEMPENVRNTLTPFLTSRYVMTSNIKYKPIDYPVFQTSLGHSLWLRNWVCDMLWRAKGENPHMLFPVLARLIKGHDLAIAEFLLPYAALNIVLGGSVKEVQDVARELLTVLSTESLVESEKEVLRQCSENVFVVLDYMSRWVQEKKRALAAYRHAALRAGHSPSEFNEAHDLAQIDGVEGVISSIPAHIIAQRAIECGSYARALFHWEHFIREQLHNGNVDAKERDVMYERLQVIYTQIDEPDGLEGISAKVNILSPEQQAFQHRQAGRYAAAQSWYEIEASAKPHDVDLQLGLLSCLRESGQYSQVLRFASDFAKADVESSTDRSNQTKLLSFATEACWITEDFQALESKLGAIGPDAATDFNLSIGGILLAIRNQGVDVAAPRIQALRSTIIKSLSPANASSLQSCHDTLLKLHVLYDVQLVAGLVPAQPRQEDSNLPGLLEKRLAVLGSYISDKQYVLGIRRAVGALSDVPKLEIGSSWLTTARLARKANVSSTAHYAVLRASQCGDDAAKIEQARLLWRDGQHRQAIHSLDAAIASNVFASYDKRMEENSNPEESQLKQNMLSAKAHLLLAKWLDRSGQTQSSTVTLKYQQAARMNARWEKGHYYLGKSYNKILEAEKASPPSRYSEAFLCGETVKLVIENYVRSIAFGAKYWYQTIPKLLTLWLDLGMDCMPRSKHDRAERIEVSASMMERRQKQLELVHRQIKKYFERMPPYIFYTALPQLISRISHPNPKVFELLSMIITKIVSIHPSQALWSLLAVAKATSQERASRGLAIINKLKDPKSRTKSDSAGLDLRSMIVQGQRLSDGLLQACEMNIEGRATNVSLSKDLGFSHKLAPSALVIPIESNLTVNVPTVQDASHIRHFRAFAQDRVTIASFSDDVLVLSSLQRPRKLTVRGSDGKLYGLLCKPKDDLRKDQRLMEFNTMINRALKTDAESSKRRLYIKTYGVTPLSEESGTIEWVEGIKPLRDILLKLYQRKGIQPNYTELRVLLGEASANDANVSIFTDKILPMFPPLLHEWFVEVFPEPDTWFAARIRYARSAAVMSMVGHVLGLGDRHGENILLEEGTGGVFHVDFNCLFDKGKSFERPEVVPFRLTHNMVDAMGAYGYEGPFRKSSELTLGLLRQHQDTLMNILETFLHDPTTDFIGKKKRSTLGVPDTPQEVLDSVSSKLKGFLLGESVPLSVEGHVDALIAQAVDPWNLCQMYIGWCAFL